jgi:hypothetical protein
MSPDCQKFVTGLFTDRKAFNHNRPSNEHKGAASTLLLLLLPEVAAAENKSLGSGCDSFPGTSGRAMWLTRSNGGTASDGYLQHAMGPRFTN